MSRPCSRLATNGCYHCQRNGALQSLCPGPGGNKTDTVGEVKLPSGQSVIYSGHEEDGANHTEGVAIMMTKETRKALIACEPISSRLITASFRTNNRRVKAHIIQCYAPTNDAVDDVKAKFYDSLNHLLGRVGARDLIILMSDFNAKIGGRNEGYEEIMGKHGVGKMNDNGEMFVETCVNKQPGHWRKCIPSQNHT
ncbi:hypothetical protein NHX12_024019 [Muraenolepis orangiensis]|uniref:Endonuclease/exonuclease/phosphatase domain-containing protein n=1 Tax=Muraenolepis orangiensis TaxID=630683 RepID=A0A9Q0EPQ5_9TELE|nr:hypothetical protein NHX12_024019 [Muraenolepis orangiensis]